MATIKKFKNLETGVTKSKGSEEKASYFNLCEICLETIPQGGLDVRQMRARLDVQEKITEAKGKDLVSLSSTEVATLKGVVSSFKWAIMHRDIVGFIDAVEKL